ncbi:hypothetical protein QFC22_004557 [Naganishia vaughanmartiniae]|uniref:Uncharacterized protein n=1 Tax=Naganishia vaughanmartiniae TaxID=1424756 RepID=A0ACC2X000_9TREE|nr:hypothetical protein QFC22_004557 [Naganishia vaughanmartiniae]
MSSHLQNARAANRVARAREQDEESSEEDEVAETQASQSRRRKGKGRARDSDEDDDGDDVASSQMQRGKATQTQGGATQGLTVDISGSAAFKKKVHDLVKLALYQEYRKQPLRKDDINKKVMERANAKVFNAVFDEAQAILRLKFGMELVGLRQRVEEAAANGANGEDAIGAATQKKKGTAGAKAYILRSVLPASLISLMSKPKPLAQDGSTAHIDLAAPTGGEGDGKVDCGALIDWQKGDGGPTGGIAMVGLLWVVLGTILVHDRTLQEEKLKTIFSERLDIQERTVLPLLSRDQVRRQITFDEFLKNLVKQNYLEKVKIPGVNQGEELAELRWGARADAEFGEQEVAEFMVDIMATRELIGVASDDEEEDARPARGKRGRNGQNGNHANGGGAQKDQETPEQRRTKMMDNIKQAAGTELHSITKA